MAMANHSACGPTARTPSRSGVLRSGGLEAVVYQQFLQTVIKMMPPKKSKAAREKGEMVENGTEAADAPEAKEDVKTKASPEQGTTDIFTAYIVDGKRKREAPPAEKFLHTWFADNFERHDDPEQKTISKTVLYDKYCDSCVEKEAQVVDVTLFNRVMKTMFPKGIGVKERSMYVGDIKETSKASKEAKAATKKTDVPKWMDIINKAFTDLKNPMAGLHYAKVKSAIIAGKPEMRVSDNMLLYQLDREVYAGRVVRLRGIRRCGVYRLPGDSLDEEEMRRIKVKEEKAARAREAKKEEREKKEMEKKDDGKDGAGKGASESDKGDDSGKENKAKKAEEVKPKPKRKRNKLGPMPRVRKDPNYVVHSAPKRVLDTFQLAMTYMTEPKEASVKRIVSYVDKHYVMQDANEKVQKCISSGIEKGYFELIRGSTSNGTIQLSVDEFDPSYDDNILGMVINAVVASAEPKQCTIRLIESYIQDFHEEFRITERKHLLKRAIEKAEADGLITRLSGVGLSGTVKLNSPFLPSPRILQGDDTEDDYVKGYFTDDISAYQDRYRPRPTKRGGHGRTAAAGVDHYVDVNFVSPSAHSPSKRPETKIKNKRIPDQVEDFLDDYKPRPSKSRSRQVDWVELEVPMRKKPKVAPAPKTSQSKQRTKADQNAGAVKSLKRERKPPVVEEEAEESDVEDQDETPKKKRVPDKKTKKAKSKESESEGEDEVETPKQGEEKGQRRKSAKKPKYADSGSEDEDPRKRSRKPTKSPKYKSEESDVESEEELPKKVTVKSTKTSKSARLVESGSDSEDENVKKSHKKGGRHSKARYGEDSDVSEEEGMSKSPRKRDTPKKKYKESDSEIESEAEKPKSPKKQERKSKQAYLESESGSDSERETHKKKPHKKSESRSKPKYADSESEADSEDEKSKRKPSRNQDRRSQVKYKQSGSEDSEDEKPRKKAQAKKRSKREESDSEAQSGSEVDRAKKSKSRRRSRKR